MLMKMDNPCCCIPLKKGVIFIAVIDIVIGVLGAGLGIFSIFAIVLVSTNNPSTSANSNNNDSSSVVAVTTEASNEGIEGIANTTPSTTTTDGGSKVHSASLMCTLLGLFALYCLMQVLFGFVLILGITKERLLLLKAYLGFRLSGALFTLGTFAAFIVLREQATIKPSVIDGFSFLFSLYCIYVVYVLTMEIKSKSAKTVKPYSVSNATVVSRA